MIKFIAVFFKEWKLLWRDKIGLIFLFILPMCLVLFITLALPDDEGSGKPRQIKLLLLNKDPKGTISKHVVDGLKKIEDFTITQKNSTSSENIDRETVAKGNYQAFIVIPKNFSQDIEKKIQSRVPVMNNQALAMSKQNLAKPNLSKQTLAKPVTKPKTSVKTKPIEVLFDPALPKNFQYQIESALKILNLNIELALWQQMINPNINSNNTSKSISADDNLIKLKAGYVETANLSASQPNTVQQNVPAWALFGMFFIITPLSGMIVKERRLGVMNRLYMAPVSFIALTGGKICAFICLNLFQLVLMLSVGIFILPLFGLPVLNVSNHLWVILGVGLSASLAATGSGLLIGSLVKTAEQANVIGPFIIVIAAAIGGIFTPIYLLPPSFQKMSNLSPMNWALQALVDIFVRNAHFTQLLPNITKLLGFALVTAALAILKLRHYRR